MQHGRAIVPGRLIRDVIRNQKVVVVSSATTVLAGAQLLAQHRIGALPVVDGGKLVGIFTERDVVTRVVCRGRHPKTTAIGAVMTKNPVTATPKEKFGDALLRMHEGGFRHLPVVEDGRVVGIVSIRNSPMPDRLEFERERELHDRILEGMR
jgi:CBS domain-containing protein